MADVYLLYAKSGALLYVGVSNQSGFTRAIKHRAWKPWGSDIYRAIVKRYETFQRACVVEARAISLLGPMHNIASQRNPADRKKYSPTTDQYRRHRAIWLDPVGGTYESKRKQISADYGSELTRGILNGRFGWLGNEKTDHTKEELKDV